MLLFGRQLVKYGGLLLLQKLRHLLKTDTVYIVGGVLVVLMKHNNVETERLCPLKSAGWSILNLSQMSPSVISFVSGAV